VEGKFPRDCGGRYEPGLKDCVLNFSPPQEGKSCGLGRGWFGSKHHWGGKAQRKEEMERDQRELRFGRTDISKGNYLHPPIIPRVFNSGVRGRLSKEEKKEGSTAAEVNALTKVVCEC